MSIHAMTEEVEKEYGEDLLLEMINPFTTDTRVKIEKVINHDVINREIYGSVTLNGSTKYYSVEDGNNNGTVFHYLSKDKPYIPNKKTIRIARIVPLIETPLSLMKAKAMQDELDDIARSINYDSYHTGNSIKTSEYWKDKVSKLKGKIVYEELEVDA